MKSISQHYTLYILLLFMSQSLCLGQGFEGYYRFPDIYGQTIIFTAEGDLWKVSVNGGTAQRLTTHPNEETHPKISPDGKTIAFTAYYEGPAELYTMPIEGGLPQRWTYERESATPTGWTPQGAIVYASNHYATLPEYQLIQIDPNTKKRTRVPLYQASEGTYKDDGKTVFFVRPADHRNVTKRYKGGTARKIWKFTEGTEEAIKLSDSYEGESHHPMWWNNRVYFITDRDGTMNIWSMDENGGDLVQHTQHKDFDVRYASLSQGKIVYQRGADICLLDIATKNYQIVPIRISSDLDQLREKWVTKPQNYISSVNLHPQGDKLVITARGRVFVAPTKSGRMVQLSREEGVRYRDAVFMPNGRDILVLSDKSGEFEFYQAPANGIQAPKMITENGKILRYQGVPSPDGKWVAYTDLNSDAWLFNLASKTHTKISTNQEGTSQISWSPDSRWLSFVQNSTNTFAQIFAYGVESQELIPLTSDRANSSNPTWSPDGKWIYFLSDRNFQTLVGSPWGSRQPEPYFDQKYKLYHISLQKGLRSPFRPMDELYSPSEPKEGDTKEIPKVVIDKANIQSRIAEVPLKPGNYRGLAMNAKTIYFLSSETGVGAKTHLMALPMRAEKPKPKVIASEVNNFALSNDGKKMMINKVRNFYVAPAGMTKLANLNEHKVDLSNWKFLLDPQEDWKQIFTDAWRMERDYFYDPNMHGVDWEAMYKKYLPLIDRVTTRLELSDLIGRFVGELSALHTSVRGGDIRTGVENIRVGSLAAQFNRMDQGYEIKKIYRVDPDYPHERGPLDDPYLGISEGDIITHIDGDNVLDFNHINALLRNKSNQQVRIRLINTSGQEREVIVKPTNNEYNIRYRDWEYSRRTKVEEMSQGKIGYVHLRAMGRGDIEQWYREFYPVYNREGLIIDVRGNRGGNIESLILEKLLRKPWFYWKFRSGEPYGNMQYAFAGHMVVLMDARTASDGEAFAEGFKKLGLGKLIGVRTWGGEIWLSSANRLSDGGLARAPMMGVYGLGSEWLIEGHGVEPDIEVDNLPHQTFKGEDAQLERAIQHLQELMEKEPVQIPKAPPYPDKSFGSNKKEN